jgi:hypothetical protein
MAVNRYRSNIPVSEKILKDFLYRLRSIILYFKNGFRNKRVLFYPEYPTKRTILYKILKRLDYNITNNPGNKAQLIINWENVTIRQQDKTLNELSARQPVINYFCQNISKQFVDKIHQEVFGYSTIVDPKYYNGKCVKKSDANAKHDGRIINCPVQNPEKEYVYQIVINNLTDGNMVRDIRVPVIKNEIPFVYLKYRPIETRFKNDNTYTELYIDYSKIISDEERSKIFDFCKKMGLDYGELDILRNKDDGKIYIIDVNYTPWGPPNHLSNQDYIKAIKILSESFKKQFLINIK